MTEAFTSAAEEADRIVEEGGMCWTSLSGVYEAELASEAGE